MNPMNGITRGETQDDESPPIPTIIQLIKSIFHNASDVNSKELSQRRELIYDLVDCVTHMELIRQKAVETSNNAILFHSYYEDQNKHAPASRCVLTLDDNELEQIQNVSNQSNKSKVNMRDFYLLILNKCLALVSFSAVHGASLNIVIAVLQHLWYCLSTPRSSVVVQCLHTYFPGPKFTGKRPLFLDDLSQEERQNLKGDVYDKFLDLMTDVARWDEEHDQLVS
jgi:hypothetical protein